MTDINRDAGNEERDEAEERFLRLLSRERRRLHYFIFSLVPNSTDAEDIFQQTSIAMWKKFQDYDPDRDFYAWACGVAFFTVQNFRRSSSRRKMLFSDETVRMIADQRAASAERGRQRLDLLQDCLALLPKRDRELIRNFYEEGASAKDVALRVGMTVQSIHNRLSKVRSNLMACVKRKGASAAWSS